MADVTNTRRRRQPRPFRSSRSFRVRTRGLLSNECRVRSCGSINHITAGHRCSDCGKYGHDHYECGHGERIAHLREISRTDRILEPCDVIECRFKHTHSTRHHYCRMCNRLYPQCECTGSLTNSYIDHLRLNMENHMNEMQRLLEEDDIKINDVVLTHRSRPSHVKCPICRAVNIIISVDKYTLYGITQLCPICQELEINVSLPDCKHCLCKECLNKISEN